MGWQDEREGIGATPQIILDQIYYFKANLTFRKKHIAIYFKLLDISQNNKLFGVVPVVIGRKS